MITIQFKDNSDWIFMVSKANMELYDRFNDSSNETWYNEYGVLFDTPTWDNRTTIKFTDYAKYIWFILRWS